MAWYPAWVSVPTAVCCSHSPVSANSSRGRFSGSCSTSSRMRSTSPGSKARPARRAGCSMAARNSSSLIGSTLTSPASTCGPKPRIVQHVPVKVGAQGEDDLEPRVDRRQQGADKARSAGPRPGIRCTALQTGRRSGPGAQVRYSSRSCSGDVGQGQRPARQMFGQRARPRQAGRPRCASGSSSAPGPRPTRSTGSSPGRKMRITHVLLPVCPLRAAP